MLKVLLPLVVALLVQAVPLHAQHNELDDKTRLSHILSALDLKPGSVVADVGAGGGAYVGRLSEAVGAEGKVLAVDINTRALERLRARLTRDGLQNVEVIEGAVDDPRLPTGGVDAILVVHAYHEMTEHGGMLARMREALKPGGRLVIVEPISPRRRGTTRDVQTRAHQLAPEFALQEIQTAGFRLASFDDPLPADHGHDGHHEWLLAAEPQEAVTTTAPVSSTPVDALRILQSEFLPLYQAGQVIVLDVRDPASFARGHIPTAVLAPMSALRNLTADLQNAAVPIVAYCECPAEETSLRAVSYLRQRGITNVRALVGGWEGWTAAGHAVERP